MKLSSRLLLVLLPTVVGIMALYATWAVRQREVLALEQTEAEARVFSTAVGLAFAHAFRDLQLEDVQDILASIDDEPGIYGVVFYEPDGTPTMSSTGLQPADLAPAATVRAMLDADSVVVLDQVVGEERVQSVLRTVEDRDGAVIGVLEVVQPLSFVQGERVRTTRRFILNTATLVLALAVVLTFVVGRYVRRPVEAFASAIHRLGDGELSQRLDPEPWKGELEGAVLEFNRMVDRLAAARAELERETDERLALQEQVREQEHLAQLGTLAAGVAHQIATPLSVIGGRAEGLLRMTDRPPDDARSLDIIRKQSQRISRIVRNLLHFARRPEPQLRTFDAGAAVDRALELFASELEELGVDVERDFDPEARVRADPELLEEVLMTLLDNALHALREPGATARMRVLVAARGDETVIELRDGGQGVPEEAFVRIFEPFFTTRSGGTGLGLSVAEGIVRQLGGRLEIENSATPADADATTEESRGRLRGAVARVVLPGDAGVTAPRPDTSPT